VIVVFGSVNLDLVARVDRLPRPGETVAGLAFAAHAGGKGANQALAARRAGAEVALVAAIGRDDFARAALRSVEAAAIDLSRVARLDAPTGVALIHVDARGENCITVVAGANAQIDPGSLPDDLLQAGTTVVMQLEVPLEAVANVAARARARGARTVLNAAPARALPRALLAAIDALIVNEIEAAAVAAGLDAPPAPDAFAQDLHRRFGCATIVTLGAEGALMAANGTLVRAPAPPVGVVDTTGAGDAFAGAFAAALDRGEPWSRALAAGVAAGSLACTVAGAQLEVSSAADIAALANTVSSRLHSQPIE
jgi:ribokinase